MVDEATSDKVQNWLREHLPKTVKIVPCIGGEINPDLLLGFNAAVEDNLDSRPSHHDTEEEHEHDDEINSVHLVLDEEFEPKGLVEFLKRLVANFEIYRIKGFVAVPSKPMRLVLQGVGSRFDYFYDRLWQREEIRHTKLVLIGRSLQTEKIQSELGNHFSI